MKVLFTVQPLFGHFHSMVPLADALRAQGHAVAFATGAGFGPYVKRAGFEHFACGLPGSSSGDILTGLPEWPSIAAPHEGIRQVIAFIQGLGPRMADDLVPLVKQWKPDLIVRDPLEFGGYIAAECAGIPYASILWALYISPRYGCADALDALRRRYGPAEDPGCASFDRYFVLNALPPSWGLDRGAPPPPVTHRYRMEPFDLSVRQDLPDWVRTLDDGPVVYVTLGTTFNGQPHRFRALMDAVSDGDYTTVITVGQSLDPSQFHPLPPRVKLERYIPQTLILPYCDAMVFHGGFNSLHSALRHGLPMVIMPLGAGDQEPTARQCAELGLGVAVDDILPGVIRSAIDSVLSEPRFRLRAEELRREMENMPGLEEAVRRLEVLAVTHEPQLH